MALSIFEMFSIGIGPSSSHTVGPMVAANEFVRQLHDKKLLDKVDRIQVDLYGSLALTGDGHGTNRSILNGLEGKAPDTVDAESILPRYEAIKDEKQIILNGTKTISFDFDKDYQEHQKIFLDKHSNGLKFTAFENDTEFASETYYSIGGGFIVTEDEYGKEQPITVELPFPFSNAEDILKICEKENFIIDDLMMKNEQAFHTQDEIKQRILKIASVMFESIDKGINTEGILPGGLNVKRRAKQLYHNLQHTEDDHSTHNQHHSTDVMNWLNAYAMAVNEENAAGHRIVTAPTNGAAGVIPAVLKYYRDFSQDASDECIIKFFLNAAAIGILCKKNASISGAEVGCQGEVGSAAAMAAAGLAAVWGGTPEQIENAAEIALEHHLGMTCDPVKGLVQIPCIERNAMGAVKAVNAARMALVGDGLHHVSLDKAIKTMFETGRDMMTIYKETSLGGLAVNVTEC